MDSASMAAPLNIDTGRFRPLGSLPSRAGQTWLGVRTRSPALERSRFCTTQSRGCCSAGARRSILQLGQASGCSIVCTLQGQWSTAMQFNHGCQARYAGVGVHVVLLRNSCQVQIMATHSDDEFRLIQRKL